MDDASLKRDHDELMESLDKKIKGTELEKQMFKNGTNYGIQIGALLVYDRLLKLHSSKTFSKNFIEDLEKCKSITDKEEKLKSLFKELHKVFIGTAVKYTGKPIIGAEW